MHNPKTTRLERMVQVASAALRKLQDCRVARQFGIPAVKLVTEDPDGVPDNKANLLVTLSDGNQIYYRLKDENHCRRWRNKMRHNRRERGLCIQEVTILLMEELKFVIRRFVDSIRSSVRRVYRYGDWSRLHGESEAEGILSMPRVQGHRYLACA